MSEQTQCPDLETRILNTAETLFIEKGFTETSMSEIAAKAGIKRPVLHYYYRTKDKMFRAISGRIFEFIVPKIQDILQQKDRPLAERLENVVDTYYAVFRKNPSLPLFVMREMHRDANYLFEAIRSQLSQESLGKLKACLEDEMAQGKIKRIPTRILFLTFYSMLTFPFLTQNLSRMLLEPGETFDTLLEEWKRHVVNQMENLLRTE